MESKGQGVALSAAHGALVAMALTRKQHSPGRADVNGVTGIDRLGRTPTLTGITRSKKKSVGHGAERAMQGQSRSIVRPCCKALITCGIWTRQ